MNATTSAIACRHCGAWVWPCNCGANGGRRHWAASPTASYRCDRRATWAATDSATPPDVMLHEPLLEPKGHQP